MTLPAELAGRLDAAVAAAVRQRSRPRRDVATVLAAAARRWEAHRVLRAGLVAATRLSAPMVDLAVPLAAAALDAATMHELAERELAAAPARRPALVAHVLASNVPALALPAIALSCLAGVAAVVRSGRADPLSAPAFHDAIAAIDPDLAATIVPVRWPIADEAFARAALDRADIVVASGTDATMAALARRLAGRLVAHGARTSVAVVAAGASVDADALARDIALHDQRGCLSPRIVYVEGDAESVATAVADALGRLASRLPYGPLALEERVAARALADEAEWEPGVRLHARAGGLVLVEPGHAFRPPAAPRSVRIHAIPAVDALPDLLPVGAVECVGIAGDPTPLLDRLRARGVARVCPIGRMQQPALSWPRGQRPPIRSLLGLSCEPLLEVAS